jgi:hypothetical protein
VATRRATYYSSIMRLSRLRKAEASTDERNDESYQNLSVLDAKARRSKCVRCNDCAVVVIGRISPPEFNGGGRTLHPNHHILRRNSASLRSSVLSGRCPFLATVVHGYTDEIGEILSHHCYYSENRPHSLSSLPYLAELAWRHRDGSTGNVSQAAQQA